MRTTIAIDDSILAAAKERAASKQQTLGEFVEDAVRQSLVDPGPRAADPVVPVFTRGGGALPGIDLNSNHSLYDALDAAGDLR